jgi:spore coat protein A
VVQQQRLKIIVSLMVMGILFFTMVFYKGKTAVTSNTLAPELDPNKIPKFVNQLVIPPEFEPEIKKENKGKAYQQYHVDITQFKEQILPTKDTEGKPLNPSTVWGYGGIVKKNPETGKQGYYRSSPGPTFDATQGIPIKVEWENKIKGSHLFPVDPTLDWANPNNMPMMPPMPWPTYPSGFLQAQSPVPLVPHLHGGEVSSKSDGSPNAWWTANGKLGPDYSTNEYTYPNQQNPTTLWYHDHTMGMTRINVMSGLAGFYLLRNPNDKIEKSLPKGEYEVPLVIQDRTFRTDGSLAFNTEGDLPNIHPYWMPEFFGNTVMVNGKVWPNFKVKKRQYRFRVLNGSNARFYNLKFSNGMSFTQIGSDGGFLPKPVNLTNLVIAPGERADILVDFSQVTSKDKIVLQNSAKTPYPDGDDIDPNTSVIMQFSVSGKSEGSANSVKLPDTLNTIPKLVPNKKRVLTLTEVQGIDANGDQAPIAGLLNGQHWEGNISETPQVGSTEEWQVVNLTMDTHPIHLHLVQFQVVGRYKLLDPSVYEKDWLQLNQVGLTDQNGMKMLPFIEDYRVKELPIDPYISKDLIPPTAGEMGWKDTLQMNPGEVTIIRFRVTPQNADPAKVSPGINLYPFDPTVGPGYVWHCHILDHEDNEMMRPMKIVN